MLKNFGTWVGSSILGKARNQQRSKDIICRQFSLPSKLHESRKEDEKKNNFTRFGIVLGGASIGITAFKAYHQWQQRTDNLALQQLEDCRDNLAGLSKICSLEVTIATCSPPDKRDHQSKSKPSHSFPTPSASSSSSSSGCDQRYEKRTAPNEDTRSSGRNEPPKLPPLLHFSAGFAKKHLTTASVADVATKAQCQALLEKALQNISGPARLNHAILLLNPDQWNDTLKEHGAAIEAGDFYYRKSSEMDLMWLPCKVPVVNFIKNINTDQHDTFIFEQGLYVMVGVDKTGSIFHLEGISPIKFRGHVTVTLEQIHEITEILFAGGLKVPVS